VVECFPQRWEFGKSQASRALKNFGVLFSFNKLKWRSIIAVEKEGGLVDQRFEKYTERSRRVLTLAQEEAIYLRDNTIRPEFLLIGLLRERDGIAAKVLNNLGATLHDVREVVSWWRANGALPKRTFNEPGEFGIAPEVLEILDLAVEEARNLRHHYIATEHLLLALVSSSGNGLAGKVFQQLTLDDSKVRAEVRRLLEQSMPSTTASD
jgi:ATP-dependent Clp protease ATP-binding subunit ClpC